MISCTLGDRKYTVDFVSGRALREIEPAMKMYTKISAISEAVVKGQEIENTDNINIPEAMDVMTRWFCLAGCEIVPAYPSFSRQRRHLGYPVLFALSAFAISLGSFSGFDRLIVISRSPNAEVATHFMSFAIRSVRI